MMIVMELNALKLMAHQAAVWDILTGSAAHLD